MENKFASAIRSIENFTTTENGRVAYKNSGSHLLDFFYNVAALRKANYSTGRPIRKNGKNYPKFQISNEKAFENSQEYKKALNLFFNAYDEHPILAVGLLFWLRDVRGGAGERQLFRSIYKAALKDPKTEAAVLCCANLISEYGRWDDLWNCLDPFDAKYENILNYLITQGLENPKTSQLLSKWLPRERGKNVALAQKMAQIKGLTPKSYRYINSTISRDLLEVKMSKKKWDDIVFEHVPSIAMSRYTQAFNKNAQQKFFEYKKKLAKGETKVNAGAIFPYEIIKNLSVSNDNTLATSQWAALPNYIQEDVTIMPVVDVSGSMCCQVAKNVSAMDVAVSLGMYCAERQTGPFKDLFMTFSANPRFINLKSLGKSLKARIDGMKSSDWGMNTNIDSAMKLILKTAIDSKADQRDLPDVLLILSDMQFDEAVYNRSYAKSNTFLNSAKKMFNEAGYKMPHVVFWNLRATNNTPALYDTPNVSMVSGFSPSIMKSILSGEEYTPLDTLLNTIVSERYLPVLEAVGKMLS